MRDEYILVYPEERDEDEITAYRDEMRAADSSMDGTGSLRTMDILPWVRRSHENRFEATVAPGLVPADQYLYVRARDRRIVGMIQIRHRFNVNLSLYGGHIGYSVRPSERLKGHGVRMLAACLPLCPALGIKRVLITCRKGNAGSRGIILKNGGVYESTIFMPAENVYLERYWIDLMGSEG